MDLHEAINRGRFIFADAPERLKVFELLSGKRSALDIAKLTKRHVNSINRDLRKLFEIGFIEKRRDKEDREVRIAGLPLYVKIPILNTIPISYFRGPSRQISDTAITSNLNPKSRTARKPRSLPVPNETEILDICRNGEDQLYEFKAAGTDVRKITKEVAAMLNTRVGGFIFYGVDDSGTIHGSDLSLAKLDQPLQNSIKNSISPAATVAIRQVTAVGYPLLIVVVPPWNRSSVYQFDEKVLIRKGTNVFGVKPEELRKLHRGQYVV